MPHTFSKRFNRLLAFSVLLIAIAASNRLATAQDIENLCRNGSFEGSLLYWHNTKADNQMLVEDAKVGKFSLKSMDHSVMSAPIVCEMDNDYTVSLWAKSINSKGTIDGVTVTEGKQKADDYIPRRNVEVLAECTNLPGYEGAAANIFEHGATVEMRSHLANTTDRVQRVTARWQLIDYEGVQPLSDPVDETV